MKLLISFVLLSLNSYPCFSTDLANYRAELAGLGVSDSALAPAAIPGVIFRRYPGGGEETSKLLAEALADPDKFIDEHTPEEVGTAFGLAPERFQITDRNRIENAAVRLTVDLTRQRLVLQSSTTNKEFKISSGLAPDHATPGSGKCYGPDFLEAMHYSTIYNKAPMPNSIFFNGNIAMHATGAESLLGRPASHGCVRLSKADSKTVYDLVRASGRTNAVICVQGVTPEKAEN